MYEPVTVEITRGNESVWSRIGALFRRLFALATVSQEKRLLHVREMLFLGDKKFIAVVEYDRRRLLIAGTPQNISLLDRLDSEASAQQSAVSAGNAFGMKQTA